MSRKQIAVAVAISTLMLVVLWAIAMGRGLNVDEHQFVASGALLAREGLLPYRDYPFFHTPDLSFVYALLFRCTDYLLLSARLLSVLCAFLGLILISRTMWRSLSEYSETFRAFITASAAILLFSNPVFRYSCWRAWNHPLATLFATIAVLCLWRALDDRKSGRWYFAAGLLLSLTISTRLTFAPLGLAFAGISLFLPRQIVICRRMRNALLLTAGAVLGALPMLWLFAVDPRAFIFNNFTWNGPINELYERAAGKYVSLGSKFLYILTHMLRNPGNLALLLMFLAVQYAALRQREFRKDARNLLLMVSLPCLLIGALAPAIPYDQYFYALASFLVLGLVPPVITLATAGALRSLCWGFGAAAMISLFSTAQDFRYLAKLPTPSRWAPIRLHQAGMKLAQIAGPGPILTLAPITPLEGRLRIYRALATSPFTWKTAGFLSEEQRREFGFIKRRNLASALDPPLPGAICTGNEGEAEETMLRYKDSLGYISFRLPNGETAWVSKH